MENLAVVQPSDYKLIPLLHGHFAKVDNEDFERINSTLWIRNKAGYAASRRNKISIWMHREVMHCQNGLFVDHIGPDKSDNRKANLRICTRVENQGNRWKSKHAKTSQFKGVSFCKRDEKFAAYGRERDKSRRLGTFGNEIDAARAYDKWAAEYFGEFAVLNLTPEIRAEIESILSV